MIPTMIAKITTINTDITTKITTIITTMNTSMITMNTNITTMNTNITYGKTAPSALLPLGTNDPFVMISLGKEKFQTSVKEKAGQLVDWAEQCEL